MLKNIEKLFKLACGKTIRAAERCFLSNPRKQLLEQLNFGEPLKRQFKANPFVWNYGQRLLTIEY